MTLDKRTKETFVKKVSSKDIMYGVDLAHKGADQTTLNGKIVHGKGNVYVAKTLKEFMELQKIVKIGDSIIMDW